METQKRNRKLRSRGFTLTALRRSLIYKPLAIVMAVLLLPALSWMESGGANARPFQANAQAQGCTSTTNSIIQNYCVNGSAYFLDLFQFEQEAVDAYRKVHSLPTTDAHVIYDYGRQDLRNAVRGVMMDLLKDIILKPASKRTAHEQALYNWLQTLVQQNEIGEYTAALNNYASFQANACGYQLDPNIAAQYSLSYNGTPWCYGGTPSAIFSPEIPSGDYFTAYGIEQSYQKPASTDPAFGQIVAGTAAGEVGYLTAAKVLGGIAIFTESISLVANIIAVESFVSYSLSILATISTYAGPAGIILDCIIAGIEAGIQIYNDQQALAALNNIKNSLAQVQAAPPDLTSFVNNSVGLQKLRMTLVGQTVPDKPSSAVLPTHQTGDLSFSITPAGGGSSTVVSTLQYQDWSKNVWSAQTSGGWFVETCTVGTGSKGPCSKGGSPQSNSMSTSLNYVDWAGVNWTAMRSGSTFSSTKADPASSDVDCPADSLTGVSPGTNFSNCSTYVSKSIPLTDSNGNHVSVSLSVLALPTFTSPMLFSFAPGIKSNQTITAFGNPAPTICLTSSDLPSNFTLNGGSCGNGTFQLVFDGGLSTPVKDYSVTVKATSSIGSATQTITVKVATILAIVSSNTIDGTAGFPVNFPVVATGNPTPRLSLDPNFAKLASGLSLTDNGDGTGTISGTFTGLPGTGIFCLNGDLNSGQTSPCGIIATNTQGGVDHSVELQMTLNMPAAPAANITGCPVGGTCDPGATFIAGIPNQVLLSSTGAITHVSWSFFGQSPAPWLNLKDNGDGSALLSGTPPAGTTGTLTADIVASAFGSIGIANRYPVNVLNVPRFTGSSTATFTVGTSSSFAVSANMGTISISAGATLPKGLSFVPGNPASITGVAAAGTGGQYTVTLTDDAETAGTATQYVTLNVNEGPKITSLNTATMFIGMPGSFAVTTTGFPRISNHAIGANPLPPTDPAQGNGMYFTVMGLPADLQYSNLTPQGFAGGTLTIQGTPSAGDAGMHQVQITAQNGVGVMAQQTLTLNILTLTGAAPASGSTCNGNYNGTFNRSVTVSAGQNCAFYGGSVQGNVAVTGGHVALTNATITGNMAIQGTAGFSINGGSISGNLTIQNVASGTTGNQVCGANVTGNLNVNTNTVPINIGSTANLCLGNKVGGNVGISLNAGPVQVYGNTIEKNLTCTDNTSITGAGNVAQKKLGQCSAF